jgi:hypothetical protein
MGLGPATHACAPKLDAELIEMRLQRARALDAED